MPGNPMSLILLNNTGILKRIGRIIQIRIVYWLINCLNANFLYIDEYQCTRSGCPWDGHRKDSDWGYYNEGAGTIEVCKKSCSDDSNCGAFEWSTAYCSWWKRGICNDKSNTTIRDAHFWTCRKQGRGKYFSIIG